MKVLRCCVNCSNRDKGICCCSLPNNCNDYVDIPDDIPTINTNRITYVYDGNLKEHKKVIEEKDQQIVDLIETEMK